MGAAGVLDPESQNHGRVGGLKENYSSAVWGG